MTNSKPTNAAKRLPKRSQKELKLLIETFLDGLLAESAPPNLPKKKPTKT